MIAPYAARDPPNASDNVFAPIVGASSPRISMVEPNRSGTTAMGASPACAAAYESSITGTWPEVNISVGEPGCPVNKIRGG